MWHWEQGVILFSIVWCVLTGKVWLGYGEVFFFLLSFLSHALEINVYLSKNNRVLRFIVLSIFSSLFFITIYLAFDIFKCLAFFRFHPMAFYSILFFYPTWSLYFWLLYIYIFILFLIIIFLIYFLSSFFWLLYSYSFLDLSFYFLILSLNI